jgi:hypothetical protein
VLCERAEEDLTRLELGKRREKESRPMTMKKVRRVLLRDFIACSFRLVTGRLSWLKREVG